MLMMIGDDKLRHLWTVFSPTNVLTGSQWRELVKLHTYFSLRAPARCRAHGRYATTRLAFLLLAANARSHAFLFASLWLYPLSCCRSGL